MSRKDLDCIRKVRLVKMCSICLFDPCNCHCPNYISPKYDYHCSICGQGIINGEEFLENIDGDIIHYECIRGIRQLLDWLGHEIKTEDLNLID